MYLDLVVQDQVDLTWDLVQVDLIWDQVLVDLIWVQVDPVVVPDLVDLAWDRVQVDLIWVQVDPVVVPDLVDLAWDRVRVDLIWVQVDPAVDQALVVQDQVGSVWDRVQVDLIWVQVDRIVDPDQVDLIWVQVDPVVDQSLVVQDPIPVDQVAHKEDLLDRAVLVVAMLEVIKVHSFFVDEKIKFKRKYVLLRVFTPGRSVNSIIYLQSNVKTKAYQIFYRYLHNKGHICGRRGLLENTFIFTTEINKICYKL